MRLSVSWCHFQQCPLESQQNFIQGMHKLQWDPSNTDTLGSLKCVLIREVSSFQRCPLWGVPLYKLMWLTSSVAWLVKWENKGFGCIGLSGISGLDYWTGILEWPRLLQKALFWHDSFLESGYSLIHFANFLHAPGRMTKQGREHVSEVTEWGTTF